VYFRELCKQSKVQIIRSATRERLKGEVEVMFLGYIACMGLSTAVPRQNVFGLYFVGSIRNITDVTPRTFAPVGAPRRAQKAPPMA
jgi:hypothetical protein